MTTIQEIAKSVGFRGSSYHRIAEPGIVQTVQPIDNAVPVKANVHTSVDCYVTGEYVQRDGKRIEVKQRYTVFVAYSQDTQAQTMRQVNDRIISDFEARYGSALNVTTVYVPDLPVPTGNLSSEFSPGASVPLELYRGSELFRSMTRFERARLDIGTERTKAKVNIESIRKRYGLKR